MEGGVGALSLHPPVRQGEIGEHVVGKQVLGPDAGLQPGDVVLELNRQPIPNFDVFQRLADPIKPSDLALLLVNRQGNVLYIPVKGE